MSKDSEAPPPGGQFLVYQTQDGKLKIDVRFEGETTDLNGFSNWIALHTRHDSIC